MTIKSREKRSSRTLPVNFALLPSMLPGGTLTPVLYSVFRGIAVYRTLDPSPSASYVSLSALSIVLEIPVLHLLSRFHLRPGHDYDLTLSGIAPWRDLWVTFAVARTIVNKLGVGRSFGADSNCGPAKGLLATSADNAVSWDDGGGGIAHNWVPPSKVVPMSSYALATLSESGFSHIRILPNDKFVRTPLDISTRNMLSSRARLDEDWIGLGRRRKAFRDIVELSVLAWQSFLLNPSTPPKVTLSSRPPEGPTDLASVIISLTTSLPEAIADARKSSTFLPNAHDLQAIMSMASSPTIWSALWQFFDAIANLLSTLRIFQLLLGTLAQRSDRTARMKLEASARVQLGMAEALGWTLVAAWVADTGELAEDVVEAEVVHESDMAPERDNSFQELDTLHYASPPQRSAPSASALGHSRSVDPGIVDDIQLHSERGSIWIWASIIAFASLSMWSGIAR